MHFYTKIIICVVFTVQHKIAYISACPSDHTFITPMLYWDVMFYFDDIPKQHCIGIRNLRQWMNKKMKLPNKYIYIYMNDFNATDGSACNDNRW